MMRPQRFFIMPRVTARARRKAAVRSTADDTIPLLILHPHGEVVFGHSSVVDQNINAAASGCFRRLGKGFDRRGISKIAKRDEGALAQLGFQGFEHFGARPGEDPPLRLGHAGCGQSRCRYRQRHP